MALGRVRAGVDAVLARAEAVARLGALELGAPLATVLRVLFKRGGGFLDVENKFGGLVFLVSPNLPIISGNKKHFTGDRPKKP